MQAVKLKKTFTTVPTQMESTKLKSRFFKIGAKTSGGRKFRQFLRYTVIPWGVRELSIDMPSKLSKRQPYSQSMKEFKRPHVHKKVAFVHPKKHLMSTKRRLMSTKKVPNIHAFSFHFAATIRKFSDILATSCPHICCQF